jgi:hypothetical protein
MNLYIIIRDKAFDSWKGKNFFLNVGFKNPFLHLSKLFKKKLTINLKIATKMEICDNP